MSGRLMRPKGPHPVSTLFSRIILRVKSVAYRSPLYAWRLKGKHFIKLEASPDNPWAGSLSRGAATLQGEWRFAGHSISFKAPQDPSEPMDFPRVDHAPPLFQDWFLGFGWLSDLQLVADSKRAQNLAERITGAFTEHHQRWDHLAWRPDIIGLRIMSWTLHAPLILSSSNLVYRSAVLTSLVHQARHLQHTITKAQPGIPRFRAATGLALSGILLPDGTARMNKAFKVFESELASFVHADGGVASRNPRDGVELGRLAVILKKSLLHMNMDVPLWLQSCTDKLVPFLRAMCHGDGGFSHFGGALEADAADLPLLIDLSGSKGRAINNMPHTGYQRLKKQRTTVLVDVGPPPSPLYCSAAGSQDAPNCAASALAFEMSDGRQRIVVGLGGAIEGYDPEKARAQVASRATRSHSTIELGGADSDVSTTLYDRNENEDGIWVDANHNGYIKRCDTRHFRRLYLNESGTNLRGEDTLIRSAPKAWNIFADRSPVEAVLRFHLHPDISLSPTGREGEVIMRLPGGHGWSFIAIGGHQSIEDSQYLTKPDYSQTSQTITLRCPVDVNDQVIFKWAFNRIGAP